MLNVTELATDYPDLITQPDWSLDDRVACFSSCAPDWGSYPPSNCQGFIPRRRAARAQLANRLYPVAPQWLTQVHGHRVISADQHQNCPAADGSYSTQPHQACVVVTADCLPVVIASRTSPWVAVVHAGWRGLYQNIIACALQQVRGDPKDCAAWIGPHITARSYVVDAAFKARFLAQNPHYESCFFQLNGATHCDLSAIARLQLMQAGLVAPQIHVASQCTFADSRYPSFRRDGPKASRLITMAWLL